MTDMIYTVIRDTAPEQGGKSVRVRDIVERCVSKGFTPDQVNACIEEYEELNVWQVNTAKTYLTFI